MCIGSGEVKKWSYKVGRYISDLFKKWLPGFYTRDKKQCGS